MAEQQQGFAHDDKSLKTKLKADDRDRIIGARLRSRRKLMGFTQRELGEKVDITFQQIQKYENGKNKMSAARLMDFCDVLDVAVTYFYAGFSDIGEVTPNTMKLSDVGQESLHDDVMLKKETADLVRWYYEIDDPKLRETMLKTIKSMAKLSKDSAKETAKAS